MKLTVSPESVIQQPQARSPYWERLVCEQKCIIHFLSYFHWERCPECFPLFCKDWMLHHKNCHQKWAFFWHFMRVFYRGTGHIRIQSKKAAPHIDLLLAPEHLCSQSCALTIRLHKHQRAGLTQWQQPSFRCTIPMYTQKQNKGSRKKILISSFSTEWLSTERCATWHHPAAHLRATPPTLKKRKQASNCSSKYHFMLNIQHSNFTVLWQTSRCFNWANLN